MGSSATFSKGDLIDRFEIRELIGEGGMGAIYRAIDTKLGRTVALKVVRGDRLGADAREQARQRFLREALAVSKVDHRNVVRVLDFGYAGDMPYLAMEYLRGRDLGKLIKGTTGFMPIAEVVDIMLGVCAAIRACHEAGIIHRDLKPSNIFLCEDETERLVKILDFGVSKPPIAGDLTREGQIVGTPQYLAPEQIDGKAMPQTDQYAIGVVLYLCVTGTLPYQDRASLGLLRAIAVGKFAPPSARRADLPPKLEAVILRAMRGAPEERFESVHALGRELWEFASPEARDQWRAYYFDEMLRAPPKASTHAMPLIEAMARGLAGAEPLRQALALTPTATAPAAAGGSEGSATTVPERRGALVAEPGGTVDMLPPTATSRPRRPPVVPGRRWTAAAIGAVAAVALAGGGWFALRRPVAADPSAPVTPGGPSRAVEPAQPTVAPPPPPAAHPTEVREPTHEPPARVRPFAPNEYDDPFQPDPPSRAAHPPVAHPAKPSDGKPSRRHPKPPTVTGPTDGILIMP